MLSPEPTPVGCTVVAPSKLSQISPAAVASKAEVAEDPPSPENFIVPKSSELTVTE
jgi:hypothetical protein